MKFDHLNIPVSDLDRSRGWYMSTLGLKVEFEVPDRRTVALQDGQGFAIFLQEKGEVVPNGVALWFQVDDVDRAFADWSARGVVLPTDRRRISGATARNSRTLMAIWCACGTNARCAKSKAFTAFLDRARPARIKAPTHGWVAQLVRARHS